MNVNCIVSRGIKLSEPTKKIFLSAPLAYNNALAHSMRVNVFNDDGTAADLSGVGVTGVFLRADNKAVDPINGTTVENASGVKNIAEIILPASCYIVPGRYTFTMNLTANGSTRTVLWVEGHVERNTSEEIIDPGTPVGNIEQAIGNANSAASAANAAAETATQAAAAAQEVADNVEGEVGELKSNLTQIDSEVFQTETVITKSTAGEWASGQYRQSDGAIRSESSRIRMYDALDSRLTRVASTDTNYKLLLAGWNGENYAGWYTGDGFATSGAAQTFDTLEIAEILSVYTGYTLKLMCHKSGIEISDAVQVINFITITKESNIEKNSEDIESLDTRVTALENKDNSDLFLTRKTIPDYYFDAYNPSTFAANDYLNSRIASVPDGKHFLFITDPHWKINNARNSTALLKYVRAKLGIKHIFQGGDILNQELSKYEAKAQMALYMNEIIDSFGDDVLCVQGNHDKNVANLAQVLENNPGLTEADVALPYDEIYKTEMAYFADKVHFADWTEWLTQTGATGSDLAELDAYRKMHYYIDDDEQNIRYIVVCASNTDNNGVVGQYFGARSLNEANLQYEWFRDTLKTAPDGYDIVVLSHVIVNDKKDGTGTWLPYDQIAYYARMMSGLVTSTNVTVRNQVGTSSTDGALLDTFFASGAHTMTFNDVTATHDVVFMLGGDCHCDVLCKVSQNLQAAFVGNGGTVQLSVGDVPVITTLCDARAVPSVNQDGVKETMTAGTITEQCFEIVTITPDKRIVLTRIGAGADRSIQIV